MNGDQRVWAEFHRTYRLPEDEIHFWRTGLRMTTSDFIKLRELVSLDERERADRFHFEVYPRRTVIGGGYLRLLLRRNLDSPPARLLDPQRGICGGRSV